MYRKSLVKSVASSSFTVSKVGVSMLPDESRDSIYAIDSYLVKKGIEAQDRIALVLNNSVEMALLYIACICNRIIVCPIDPKSKADDILYCLRVAKPKHIFFDDRDLAELGTDIPCTYIGERFWDGCAVTGLRQSGFEPNDIFSITFTSGTTGNAKAIAHKAEAMLECANDFNIETEVGNGDVFLHTMPMYYMAGLLNTVLCPVLASANVVVDDAFGAMSPFSFWQTWIDNQITHTWLSPTMVTAVLAMDRADHLRPYIRRNAEKFRIFCGTAPLSAQVKEEFRDRYGIKLVESYGLSEVLYVSVNYVGRDSNLSSVGTVLPAVNLEVLETGEIVFNSNYTMAGYLQEDGSLLRPKRNRFASGDIGEIRDGCLYITGRIKDLIVKGGINISAQEIENVVLDHVSVSQAAVKGCPDAFYGEDIVCFYSGELDEVDLSAHCVERLEANKVPKFFVRLPSLPVGPTGKVRKHEMNFEPS